VPPPEFQAGNIDKLPEADVLPILKDPAATAFRKAKACQRLAEVGTAAAVPALAALLADAQLSHYARWGLEPIPGTAPDDALRAAMPKLKGKLLAGVINSIGHRKDAKAVPALTKLLYSADPDVAKAAAAALGSISGPQSAKALEAALARTKGAQMTAVAAAGIVCAEGLLAQGERAQALALYSKLSGPSIARPVRLAAMHGIIAAETSLARPR
jgi:HEAT repeat protein